MTGTALGARKAAASRIGLSLATYDAHLLAGEKWCHACAQWHRRELFGVDRARGDGLSTRCEASRVVAASGPSRAERRLALAHGGAWCRGCGAECSASEVRKGVCRDHRNADYRARYAIDGAAIRQRVLARRRSLDPIPGWWLAELREKFSGLCAYGCGRAATATDHIWPVARGGESRPSNLVPACGTCNSKKGARHPWPWVERGMAAFPEQWLSLVDLALEHNAAEWLEVV